MGLSSKKQSVKPIYGSQIEGAANTLNSTYQANAPKVQGIADTLTGLVPGMAAKYQAGNPALNAAQGYVTSTLAGDGTNPNLDAWIGQQQDSTSNALGAKLAKMGLNPAGSTYQGLQSRELGKVALGARMDDWNNGQARRAQAAGMAPGISAAETASVAPMLATAQLGTGLPMDAAMQYAQGTGGLLGQYTNTRQSGGLLGSLLGAGLSGWATGGFKL